MMPTQVAVLPEPKSIFTCIEKYKILHISPLPIQDLVIKPNSANQCLEKQVVINPWGAEGYGSCLVRICANLSVTTLTAAYLVYRLKARCH